MTRDLSILTFKKAFQTGQAFASKNSPLAYRKMRKLFISFHCGIVAAIVAQETLEHDSTVSFTLSSIIIVDSIHHLHHHRWVLAPHRWLFYISCLSFFLVTFVVLRVLRLSRPSHNVPSSSWKFLRSPEMHCRIHSKLYQTTN